MEEEGRGGRRDRRSPPGLGHHRFRPRQVLQVRPRDLHAAQRQSGRPADRQGQALCREDLDVQARPSLPVPLPLAQDGRHHQSRRRRPVCPGLQFQSRGRCRRDAGDAEQGRHEDGVRRRHADPAAAGRERQPAADRLPQALGLAARRDGGRGLAGQRRRYRQPLPRAGRPVRRDRGGRAADVPAARRLRALLGRPHSSRPTPTDQLEETGCASAP